MANEQTFTGKLRRLHSEGWNIRDVLVLDAIRANPGANGLEIGRKVNVASRSMVHANIEKLVAARYVADDRVHKNFGTPNKLKITLLGDAFLRELSQ